MEEMDAVSAYPEDIRIAANMKFGKKPASSITIHSIDPTEDAYDLYEVCKHIEDIYKTFLEVRDFLHEMITDGRDDLLNLGRIMRMGEEAFNGKPPETENRSNF